ncbi:MAG: hypothetical protein UZ18_ATM001000209 [Armatimonadetes bacterium OLB18]|nr:MAG: hypothetical protein UZ18_ATM001000209 [Armatimonadetes bacterium OLB18]
MSFCPTIAYPDRPSPLSAISSATSFNRQVRRLIWYWLFPLRSIRRVTETSLVGTGSAPSSLSKRSMTSANPSGFRLLLPLKITSCPISARRCLGLPSPRAHKIASTRFDLPQPFGPTTAMTSPSTSISVLSANVLNPIRRMLLRRMADQPGKQRLC